MDEENGMLGKINQWRAQKHKPTLASTASPRATDPKMVVVESPANMAHASSFYECAEYGSFKCPHTTSIDGDKRSDSGWFFVCFRVGGHLTRNC
jgi:hypothetical protein